MKIAIVSGLMTATPPALYGGIERVAGYLADEMAGMGLDVTLYASGNSKTAARLRPGLPVSLSDNLPGPIPETMRDYYRLVAGEADRYDIINVHSEFCEWLEPLYPHADKLVVTANGFGRRANDGALEPFRTIPVVSLTDAQRARCPWLNWVASIGLGLPRIHGEPAFRPGKYLVYAGRMHSSKGVHRAVRIAHATGLKLKVIGPWQAGADIAYRDGIVDHLLAGPGVDYLGEVKDQAKFALMRDARALLFPIAGQEGFGWTMIEAMAVGTPVIGWRAWSVPEVVDEGVTGFVVQSVAEAVGAVAKAARLDRRLVRARFEQRFTVERMALDYYLLFRRLLERRRGQAA